MCSSTTRRTSKNRSEEHTSELQSPDHLVCRLLLEKKKNDTQPAPLSVELIYLSKELGHSGAGVARSYRISDPRCHYALYRNMMSAYIQFHLRIQRHVGSPY